ncbi:MAG TPA: uroporphyrinogen-III C-methyltransferase [Blastocatellia bacterium]|nr:uroporphyrinogen-III C-methyltransferase [Blastocatellia bacterium]
MKPDTHQVGRVAIVGAGPGDPGLLTLKAAHAIASADVIVYDFLVNPETLAHARQGVELIYAGKQAGNHSLSQLEINRTLVEHARRGLSVVRLKGGDPFVFGRGGEEAEALASAGIPWEVIPGVSSGLAAAAYAGIPLTHRQTSSSVAFITGHESSDKARGVDWIAAARGADTLVIFMCAATLAPVARELVAGGRPPSTPIAIVRWGTYEHQEVHRGVLADIASLDSIDAAEILRPPLIAIVGEVVRFSETLHWFGSPAMAFPRGELSENSQEEQYVAIGCRA